MYLNHGAPPSRVDILSLLAVISIVFLVKVRADQGNEISNSWSPDQTAVSKEFSGPTSGKVTSLDVICGKNHMTVRAEFSAPFYGYVFSKGTYGQDNCIYVKQNSGVTHTTFNVYYDQCGTKPDLQGKFYENTIVIQYGSDVIEAYDEAKRLRCEWFEAYEKPATFRPAIPVADLDVVEMNFQGDDIDCWMEIQEGKGPSAREVSKIVPVGQPMTIVVAINDYNGQFDMRVKSCVAHDGNQPTIALTDEFGCVLRPKMLTPFVKIKNPGQHTRATVISYSQFLAFKFPDSMTVQIQCTVEVCRHGCADACQRIPSGSATTLQPELNLKAKWPAPDQAPPQNSYSGRNGLNSQTAPPVSRIQPAQQGNHAIMVGQGNLAPSDHDQSNYQPTRYQGAAPNHNVQYMPGSNINDAPDEMSGSDTSEYATTNKRSDEPSGQRLAPQSQPQPQPAQIDNRSDQQEPAKPQRGAAQAPSLESASNQANVADVGSYDPSSPSEQVGDGGEMVAAASNDQFDSQPQNSVTNSSASSANNNEVMRKANSESSLKVVEVQIPLESSIKPALSVGQSQSPEQISSSHDSKLATGDLDESTGRLDKQPSLSNQNQDADPTDSENSKLDNIPAGSLLPGMQPRDIEQNKKNNQNQYQNSNDQRRPNRDDPSSVISANIEAMLAGGKNQFGARSQPQFLNQQQQQQTSLTESNQSGQPESTAADNYQPASSASSESVEDKINIDRSDDPSIDQAPQLSSQSESNSAGPINDDNKSLDEQGSPVSLEEAATSESKVKPVVGTEELASGPIQIEDRIGISEGAMDQSNSPRLASQDQSTGKQQQQPEASALSWPPSGANSQEGPTKSVLDESKSEQPQLQQAMPPRAIERIDIPITPAQQQISQHANVMPSASNQADQPAVVNQQQRMMSEQNRQPQKPLVGNMNQDNQMLASNNQQPYPNVQGQAKMMPDPNAGAGRNMVALTSNMNIVNLAKMPSTLSPSVDLKNLQSSQGNFHAQLQQQQQQQQQQQAAMMSGAPGPQDQVIASNSQPTAQVTNVPINIGFPNRIPSLQQFAQNFAAQQQQPQHQSPPPPPPRQQVTPKPQKSRFSLISPHAALQAVAARLLSHKSQQQQHQAQLPVNFNTNMAQDERAISEKIRQQQMFYQQPQQQQMMAQQSQYYPMQGLPIAQHLVANQQQINNNNNNRLNIKPGLMRSRRAVSTSNEVGIKKSFMVVTGMDLAFAPNSTDPTPILDGRREDVIYGVCMPIVSLAFTITCMFWLIVFTLSFSVYMVIRSRRMDEQQYIASKKLEQTGQVIGLEELNRPKQFYVN